MRISSIAGRKSLGNLYPLTILGSNAEFSPVINSVGKNIMQIFNAARVSGDNDEERAATNNAITKAIAVGNAIFKDHEGFDRYSPVVSFIDFLKSHAPIYPMIDIRKKIIPGIMPTKATRYFWAPSGVILCTNSPATLICDDSHMSSVNSLKKRGNESIIVFGESAP